MNIRDIEGDVPPGDLLKWIFARQQELMEKYHPLEQAKGVDAHAPVDLHTCRGQQRLKDLTYRCIEELAEATGCLKNRPWKQTEVETDVDHFLEELADAFHFFIELCLAVGLDAEGLTKLYFKKSMVNEFRQRSQY
jgi:hypothetical protein